MNPATLGKAILITVECDITLPARPCGIGYYPYTDYVLYFFRSGSKRVNSLVKEI